MLFIDRGFLLERRIDKTNNPLFLDNYWIEGSFQSVDSYLLYLNQLGLEGIFSIDDYLLILSKIYIEGCFTE